MLQTSCNPCQVGQPIHLRVLPGAAGRAQLWLYQKDQRKALGEGFDVDGKQAFPLPLQVVADPEDAAAGLDFELSFSAAGAAAEPSRPHKLHVTVVTP